ncbi:MAG: hypothetical protein E6R06_11340 [Mycobacterium sp.]|nr:MAG: hypothetical protein E6R06_11340 [Mycobacterium sp.]
MSSAGAVTVSGLSSSIGRTSRDVDGDADFDEPAVTVADAEAEASARPGPASTRSPNCPSRPATGLPSATVRSVGVVDLSGSTAPAGAGRSASAVVGPCVAAVADGADLSGSATAVDGRAGVVGSAGASCALVTFVVGAGASVCDGGAATTGVSAGVVVVTGACGVFSGALLSGTLLSGALFSGALFSGAAITGATGVTGAAGGSAGGLAWTAGTSAGAGRLGASASTGCSRCLRPRWPPPSCP